MLAYKDGMSFWCTSHGCLLSIIPWLGICQTLADDLCRMGTDRLHAFLFDISEISFLQLKSAPEIRLSQTFKKVLLQPFLMRDSFCLS